MKRFAVLLVLIFAVTAIFGSPTADSHADGEEWVSGWKTYSAITHVESSYPGSLG